MKTKQKSALNYDYNQELNQTLFFFNILMGDVNNPVGTAGVGINPAAMVEEFKQRKITPNSRLWMVDAQGRILIAQTEEEIGKSLDAIVPQDVAGKPDWFKR